MLRRLILNLMTLVLLTLPSFALAAPTQEADLFSDDTTSLQNPDSQNIQEKIESKGVIASETSKVAVTKDDFIYPYKQTMAPRAGMIVDPDLLKDGEFPFLLGITYMWPRHRSPRWELGFDILLDGGAHVSLGQRHIWGGLQKFRPFIKIGALLAAQADEKLATVSDFDNYYFTGSVGLEDVINMPMSVRLELQFLAGIENHFLIFNFGYSWGW